MPELRRACDQDPNPELFFTGRRVPYLTSLWISGGGVQPTYSLQRICILLTLCTDFCDRVPSNEDPYTVID